MPTREKELSSLQFNKATKYIAKEKPAINIQSPGSEAELIEEINKHLLNNNFGDIATKFIKSLSKLARTPGIEPETAKLLKDSAKILSNPRENIAASLKKIGKTCANSKLPCAKKLSVFLINLSGMMDGSIAITPKSISSFQKNWLKLNEEVKHKQKNLQINRAR